MLWVPQRAIQTSRRASCHLSISSVQVLFTLLPPSLPVYTNCFFPNPAVFCSARLYVVAETRGRGSWDLQTPNLLLSLGCQGYCCHFNLRYHNCPIYACNSSIKSVLDALCSTFVFLYLCPTDSLPLQWFLHPHRLDGNKTLRQPWVIHASCILWNIHAVTFLTKRTCLYPPSARSQRKDPFSQWRAWRSLALMLTFPSLPNSVSCMWEGSAASRGNTRLHPPNRLWVEPWEWAAIWHRSNIRTTRRTQQAVQLSYNSRFRKGFSKPLRLLFWDLLKGELAHESPSSNLVCSCSNDLQAFISRTGGQSQTETQISGF